MYFAANVDKEKCTGCKICIFLCPEPNVIEYVKSEKKVRINSKRCKACKICVVNCPKAAISLKEIK